MENFLLSKMATTKTVKKCHKMLLIIVMESDFVNSVIKIVLEEKIII